MARKRLTMGDLKRHDYPDREALAEGLATGIAGILAGGIATRGRATLAVSGGSTPKMFFDRLSAINIDWASITIVLVDERIAPLDNERSNARLVRERLLQNRAAVAHFVPYVVDGETPEACAAASERAFEHIGHGVDAVVLGMGTDGHTASYFPNGDRLADAIDLSGKARVLAMRAEGAGEPRLTLTLPVLLEARFLALHVEGNEKQDVLKAALSGGDANEMPVRAVLNQSEAQLQVFWSP